MSDSVLIVDDEDSVRKTFEDWLRSSGLGLTLYTAADAETALRIANEHPIDLAILDWNLGAGSDGLRLLEDLTEFQPDVVAILVTGFAHVATPLDALRMGVRDYIDKNADLNRESFLRAVLKQLDRIHPAKRQRELNRSLAAFREAVEKVLPLIQTAAAFNDPVPLPEAVRSLLRFVIRATGAADGVLLVRHRAPDDSETTAAFDANGTPLPWPAVPFAHTLAASVVSHQEPMVLYAADPPADGSAELLPFETGRRSILAVPLAVGPGTSVVLELFDKAEPGFTTADKQLASAAADLGSDLLRHALSERQTHRLLFDAVEAALKATSGVTEVLTPPSEAPPPAVLDRLREGLAGDTQAVADPETTLRLVEAVRALAVRHGPLAVEHCVRVVNDLRKLLDGLTGTA